jgi:hypothetical protein
MLDLENLDLSNMDLFSIQIPCPESVEVLKLRNSTANAMSRLECG